MEGERYTPILKLAGAVLKYSSIKNLVVLYFILKTDLLAAWE